MMCQGSDFNLDVKWGEGAYERQSALGQGPAASLKLLQVVGEGTANMDHGPREWLDLQGVPRLKASSLQK